MPASEWITFLKAWLRSPTRVGGIAPSSVALARQMVEGLHPEPREAVIEFGPGTGPFTRAIEEVLPDPKSYLGIERDLRFVGLLKERFPRLRFMHGSAEQAPRFLEEAGLGRIRAVICGLPFASLPAATQDGVINGLNGILGPGSEFRTFQYVHAYPLPAAVRYRRRMREIFGPHKISRPVLWNLPPAFVLAWRR